MKLETATMAEIAKMVCLKQGHKIGSMSSTGALNPTEPDKTTYVTIEKAMCLACGATLEEIRGEA
jgi:hypothetical protein